MRRNGRQFLAHLSAHSAQIKRPARAEHRVFRLRQSEELIHKRSERVDLCDDLLDRGRRRQIGNLKPQDGEGSAQFVRHIRGELLLTEERCLQTFQHRVDRDHHIDDLVRQALD